VARQYTGSAGKITNCQIGVFAAYVSRHGHAFIDRALYLPREWTANAARLAAAHVPSDVRFATKPQLGVRMIEGAIATGVPFAWVAADTVYGVGVVEMALRKAGKGYVLGVASDHQFHSWGRAPVVSGTAEDIAQRLKPSAWRRLSAGDGTKGPRLYEWAYLALADLDAAAFGETGGDGLWTRGLLIRRRIDDGEMAYFSTWCPAGTGIETLVAVEGQRWAVEEGFEVAKTELGLDHNETRSWHGWHRHVSLVMLALAMLATIRHRANSGREKNQLPKLRRQIQAARPLVGAGSSPHRRAAGATAH
jgi:SRSO17 transposase